MYYECKCTFEMINKNNLQKTDRIGHRTEIIISQRKKSLNRKK